MDSHLSTKMPKPFDSDIALNEPTVVTTSVQQQQFELREENELTPAQKILKQAEEEHLKRELERVKREEEETRRVAEEERLRREADYRQELLKVQDEIVTLRQVLSAKLKRESELKSLLNLGFMDELKQDWAETIEDIKSFPLFQRTHATFNTASEKITPVAATAGTHIKAGLGNLRSSSYYKSFEDKLGSTKTTLEEKFGSTMNAVKSKITPSKSTVEFNENGDTATTATTTGGTTITTSTTIDDRLHLGGSSDVTSK